MSCDEPLSHAKTSIFVKQTGLFITEDEHKEK